MRSIFAATLLGAAALFAAPAFAQGIYIGPNGIGVDPGFGHRQYRDDRYRDDYRRDRSYEGRSAYEGRGRYDRDGYRRERSYRSYDDRY